MPSWRAARRRAGCRICYRILNDSKKRCATLNADLTRISPPRPLRAVHRVMLALILVFAAGVRFHGVERNGLWYDELASLSCASGSGLWHETITSGELMSPGPRPTFADATPKTVFWSSFEQEQHPPLYFLVLRGWQSVFGSSDVALRNLTILFSLVAIWFVFDAARHWFSNRSALFAAGLCAVAPPMIESSLQVRNYVPMVALVCACMAMLARIDTRGVTKLRVIGLCITAAAAMLTHYFALGALAAAALFAFNMPSHSRRWVLSAFAAAAVVFALLWGPWLVQQRANFERNREYLPAREANHATASLHRAAIAPIKFISESRTQSPLLIIPAAAFYLIPFALRRREMVLLGLWLLLPILLVLILDVTRRTEQLSLTRYFLVSVPAACILVPTIGELLFRRRPLQAALPIIVAIGCVAVILSGEPYRLNPSNPADYRKLAAGFSRAMDDQTVAVFASGSGTEWYARWLYLAMSHYAPRWPAAMVLDHQPNADQLTELQKFQTIVAVTGPGVEIEKWLVGFNSEVTTREPFAGSVTRFTRIRTP